MADVISIESKRKSVLEQHRSDLRNRKIAVFQKLFHCLQCENKCERCGAPVNDPEAHLVPEDFERTIPYHFCGTCTGEYIDYINRLQGHGEMDHYWQNDVWMELWHKWIDYHAAIDSYKHSKAFLKLIAEINQSPVE